MSLHFTTESGAHYEITVPQGAYRDGEMILRRIPFDGAPGQRADHNWVKLISHTPIEEGARALLLLEPLAHLGPDGAGNQDPNSAMTTRHTTRITRVWED